MRKVFTITMLMILFTLPATVFGQLKRDLVKPEISDVLTKPANSFLLGLFDPSRMQMHHSISMAYSTGGGNNIFYNAYMNSIDFRISDKLFLKTDIGVLSSPYNTLGENSFLSKPVFFGGAELNYQISDRASFLLKFESSPFYYSRPGQDRLFYNRFE